VKYISENDVHIVGREKAETESGDG